MPGRVEDDTWRIQNKKEIARLDEVTKLYFTENTGTVTSEGFCGRHIRPRSGEKLWQVKVGTGRSDGNK